MCQKYYVGHYIIYSGEDPVIFGLPDPVVSSSLDPSCNNGYILYCIPQDIISTYKLRRGNIKAKYKRKINKGDL